jgi:hypothetical protein
MVIMENLLLIIKKAPLVTWKAFLVLWALFLGFMGLVFKFIEFVVKFSGGPVSMNTQRSSDDGFSSEKKPVITHDKKRWNYDPWLEKR